MVLQCAGTAVCIVFFALGITTASPSSAEGGSRRRNAVWRSRAHQHINLTCRVPASKRHQQLLLGQRDFRSLDSRFHVAKCVHSSLLGALTLHPSHCTAL